MGNSSGEDSRAPRLTNEALIATALSVCLALAVAGCAAGGSSPATGGRPTQKHDVQSTNTPYRLPATGAAGFPTSIYPRPRHGGAGSIPACPAPSGVARLDGTEQARAAVYWASKQTHTFGYDLHHTDRAWWSVVRADWRHRKNWSNPHSPMGPGAPRVPVLYAGPLRGMPPRIGVPPQYGYIRHSCGARVADDSYAIIGGPRHSGALQGVLVFLNRRHHVLLYYEYP
ncbi:hypothetical protein [Mycobacterium sp.]|uniref:hypothetical protein n=1 Tax=Mycobacterium sp. TaxID=1785 RepID=UPI002BA998F7|nr:hypothetical protein [Mycobacterium sp.]HTQ19412.1 hypothetical protein [Mycobacterium sp.]